MRFLYNFGVLALTYAQLEFLQEISDANLEESGETTFTRFGNFEKIIRKDIDYLEKVIHLQENNQYHLDYRQQAAHIQELTAFVKGEKKHSRPGTDEVKGCHSYRGGTDDPTATFEFLPAWTGEINPVNRTLQFEGNCFEKISMEMNYHEHDTSVELIVKTEKPRNHTCSDFFLFGNTETMHAEDFFFRGTHKLTFKLPNTEIAQEDM